MSAATCSRCGYPRTRTACARCLYVEPGFLVEHRLTLRAECPVDGSEDVYNCIVSADRTIAVELILTTAKAIAQRAPIFQEDLTRELAESLACEVVTHGIHSGVYTTCRCG